MLMKLMRTKLFVLKRIIFKRIQMLSQTRPFFSGDLNGTSQTLFLLVLLIKIYTLQTYKHNEKHTDTINKNFNSVNKLKACNHIQNAKINNNITNAEL